MATPNGLNPTFDALKVTAQVVTPAAAASSVNTIQAGKTAVSVGANVNDTDDFIVLPSLADVPVGHTITVVSNAAGHEVRTPADSDEELSLIHI